MIIGVPKEIKTKEYRVGIIPPYTVANMPGAYPRTSTLALTNTTLPYIKTIAKNGIEKAIREDFIIKSSLNTYKGHIVNKALADSLGSEYREINEIILTL
jgi:alanine dehydrogenase